MIATGGLLNMGIFLRLAGEFFVHATGLDPAYLQWATMISLLAIAIFYTLGGGMVAVVVTNYLQFLVIGISSLTVSAMVLWSIPWSGLTKGLQTARQAGIAFEQREESHNYLSNGNGNFGGRRKKRQWLGAKNHRLS